MAQEQNKGDKGASRGARGRLESFTASLRALRELPGRDFFRHPTAYVGNVSTALLGGAVMALAAAGIIRLVADELGTSSLTLLSVGLILLLAAAATGFETMRSTLMTRKGFYGFNTTAMTLIFLTIASIVIFVAADTNTRYDTTSTGEFSLSRQTKDILSNLSKNDQRVEAVAFFVPTDVLQISVRIRAQDLLEDYRQITRRFTYRIVDPDLEPEEARRFGINPDAEPGTIVFSSGGNLQPVNSLIFTRQGQFVPNSNLEKDFSQAILAITRERQKNVYFLIGHQEADSLLTDGSGFALARLGLEGDNYAVDTLHLFGQSDLLAQSATLIIAGPKTEMPPEHLAILDDYLRNGGKALFLLDPDTPQQYRDLIRTWGVDLGTGAVVDLSSSVSDDPRTPLVSRQRYNYLAPSIFSPITQPVSDQSFFVGTSAIIPIEDQGGNLDPPAPNVFFFSDTMVITPLAVTSDLSFMAIDPDDDSPGTILLQPLAVGMSIDARAPFGEDPPASADLPRTQIVVFGDSDFVSNRFFTSFGNGDLFLNSVNWLAGDVDLISVRPKLREPRLLITTTGEFNFIRWSTYLILPITVGLAGVFAWWRRR